MNVIHLIAGILAAGLLCYLTFSLLYPERIP